tara:strand:+ start:356 stop:1147 length:792 start_codon:yes stop_codon:yes gene_type:complete
MNDQIIQKFLSRLADQYRKDAYWIRNFKELYIKAFAKVPPRFLETWMEDYLINHMPQWCPSITQVKEFIRAKPMSQDEWFLADKKEYCMHCRSEDDGSDGGLRILSVKYYHPVRKEDVRMTVSAQCDCPASQGTGRIYTDTIKALQKVDPKAVIHVDYWDFDRGGKISALQQSDEIWEHRIKHGYAELKEIDGQMYYMPIWDHDYWATSMGRVTAKTIGWEIPEEIIEKRNKMIAARGRSNKKRKNSLLSDSAVDAIFSHYGY